MRTPWYSFSVDSQAPSTCKGGKLFYPFWDKICHEYVAFLPPLYQNLMFQTQYLVKKGITIVSPPELHELLPPHSAPVEVEETATYGSCCCKGKVVARVHLPKTAYGPGEKVVGSFTLNGKQPKHILEQIEVRLVDRVTRAESEFEPKTKNHRAASMDTRTLMVRKLEFADVVPPSKGPVNLTNIHFLTIPPVVPSTQRPSIPSPVETREIKMDPELQASKLLESPSTGTLKQRKKPFICINYLIQVSAGNKLLIEIPITIHPIPLYENGIEFRPSVAEVQNFHEADETDKKALNAPFHYQPKYPVYSQSPPSPVTITNEPEHEMSITANGDVELNRSVEINDLPNGDRMIVSKEEMVIVHNEARSVSPDSEQRHSIIKRVLKDEDYPTEEEIQALQKEEDFASAPAPNEAVEPHKVAERKEPTPIPSVEITPSEEEPLPEEDHESVVIHEDEADDHDDIAKPHIQSGTDENGHVITTEDYEEGDTKTHKTVESYEYTDENGVRVEVQRTTESTLVHHEEQPAH